MSVQTTLEERIVLLHKEHVFSDMTLDGMEELFAQKYHSSFNCTLGEWKSALAKYFDLSKGKDVSKKHSLFRRQY